MKNLALFLAVIMIAALVGCDLNRNPTVDKQNEISTENDIQKNVKKFFHDGDTYTAELFVEMAEVYEGILSGDRQQTYVFDLRSKEEYDKGHIVGSINIDFIPDMAKELIERIPSDYSVYAIAETDKEAREMASKLKEVDKQLLIYVIKGGYDALLKVDTIDKYISTEPGNFGDFTKTEAEEKFNALVESLSKKHKGTGSLLC